MVFPSNRWIWENHFEENTRVRASLSTRCTKMKRITQEEVAEENHDDPFVGNTMCKNWLYITPTVVTISNKNRLWDIGTEPRVISKNTTGMWALSRTDRDSPSDLFGFRNQHQMFLVPERDATTVVRASTCTLPGPWSLKQNALKTNSSMSDGADCTLCTNFRNLRSTGAEVCQLKVLFGDHVAADIPPTSPRK